MVRCKTNVNDEVLNKTVEIMLKTESNVRVRRLATAALVIIGLLVIFAEGLGGGRNGTGPNIARLLFGAVILVFAFSQKSYQKAIIRKKTKQMDPAARSGTVEYVFEEDGIHAESHLGTGVNAWDAFKEYGTIDEYIYVRRRDDKVIMVNQNDLSKEELQQLRQLLETKLPNKK